MDTSILPDNAEEQESASDVDVAALKKVAAGIGWLLVGIFLLAFATITAFVYSAGKMETFDTGQRREEAYYTVSCLLGTPALLVMLWGSLQCAKCPREVVPGGGRLIFSSWLLMLAFFAMVVLAEYGFSASLAMIVGGVFLAFSYLQWGRFFVRLSETLEDDKCRRRAMRVIVASVMMTIFMTICQWAMASTGNIGEGLAAVGLAGLICWLIFAVNYLLLLFGLRRHLRRML